MPPRIILRIVTSEYSAHHLQVLEGLEAVRKRPGMYIGSTDSRGLMHCVWEIIDNAVDEALAGNGTRIDIVLHPDGSVEVHDTGPRHPGRHRTAHRPVRRRGRLHQAARRRQVRRRLVRGIRRSARRRRLRRERALRATRRRGRPRRQDLGDVVPPRRAGRLRRHGRALAGFALHPVRGAQRAARRRQGAARGHRHAHPLLGGPADLHEGRGVPARGARDPRTADGVPRARASRSSCATQRSRSSTTRPPSASTAASRSSPSTSRPMPPITDTWRLTGSGTFTETVPVLQPTGAMVPTEVERECHVDIAVRWGTGYDTVTRSFVNIIATPKGGTHQQGFEQELLKVLRDQVEQNARRLKVGQRQAREGRRDGRLDRPSSPCACPSRSSRVRRRRSSARPRCARS